MHFELLSIVPMREVVWQNRHTTSILVCPSKATQLLLRHEVASHALARVERHLSDTAVHSCLMKVFCGSYKVSSWNTSKPFLSPTVSSVKR